MPSKQGRLSPRSPPLSEPHIPKQRLGSYYLTRTSYLAHAVMNISKAKSFFGSTRSKLGLAKGDKPTNDRTQPSGTPGSTAYPFREQARTSLQTLHTNAAPTFDSPPTTVFATSVQNSSSREQASSPQARTSLQPPRTSTKDAAPPPVPTFDSAPTTMFAISSVPTQDGSRRLNCLIKGESIVFLVTVGRDCVVSELKEEIQRERAMSILKGIDPNLLELWKVSAIDES